MPSSASATRTSARATTESLLLAVNEFREFLTFYPTNPRADYAQYKLGMTYFKQMRGPQRDQTETREAVREFQTFVERYPNSQLRPEVEAKLREARDRVEHVGVPGRRLLLTSSAGIRAPSTGCGR